MSASCSQPSFNTPLLYFKSLLFPPIHILSGLPIAMTGSSSKVVSRTLSTLAAAFFLLESPTVCFAEFMNSFSAKSFGSTPKGVSASGSRSGDRNTEQRGQATEEVVATTKKKKKKKQAWDESNQINWKKVIREKRVKGVQRQQYALHIPRVTVQVPPLILVSCLFSLHTL